jgi:hypothetical protein
LGGVAPNQTYHKKLKPAKTNPIQWVSLVDGKDLMAAQKVAPKAAKKGSKLASFRSAIFGAPKDNKKKPAPAKSAAPAPAVVGKKAPKGADKAAAASAPGSAKKGAQSAAAPAASPALTKTKRGGGKKSKEVLPRERMAGPSIRVTYDANGEAVCREVACEGLATSVGYCRMHYIKNWKKIKRKEVILKEGKLNQYIEELVAKYPDKYIEAIRQDLANDKDFAKVIYDLDLDESADDFDVEGESLDTIVGDIKRDFDDEGDSGF